MNTTTYMNLCDVTCPHCSITFGLASGHMQNLKRTHRTFWCPACGGQIAYNEENAEEKAIRLRKAAEDQLIRERASHDQERARLRDTISRKESQRRSEKGAKTRLKKRAAAGVCPCCSRTFKQLAAHVTAMHPEFVDEAKVEAAE